jgi:hypothetical protein
MLTLASSVAHVPAFAPLALPSRPDYRTKNGTDSVPFFAFERK